MSASQITILGPDVPHHRLVLIRHGQTEWSKAGRHTGRTDLPLLPEGEDSARALRAALAGRTFAHVRCSPLERAQQTAQLAGLASPSSVSVHTDDNLVEWDYGGYEGRTTAQIRAEVGYPWSVFEHGVVPGDTPGETVEQVAARASIVLEQVWPFLFAGDVALVGHGHALRVLASVFLRQAPRFGQHLTFEVGSLGVLGHEHEQPVIEAWNQRSPAQ